MPQIWEMPSAALPMTGLERVPMNQGGGLDAAKNVPLLVSGPPYGGVVLVLDANMTADLSSTADADPGAGNVRWNNADPHAATEIYVSDDDSDDNDLAAAFAALGVGGFFYVQGSADGAALSKLQRWRVTSKSAESGYTKLGVTVQASAGVFLDGDNLWIVVQQPVPSAGGGGGGADAYTIVTEAGAFTATVGTHDGLFTYNRCAGDVTFTNAQAYTAGMVFNIRATAGLELLESGVTLTPPAGGTLELDAGMSVQVVMTGATTGDVIACDQASGEDFQELSVDPDGSGDFKFWLRGREVTGLAVPYFTPENTNFPIAMDIFPNGSPSNFTPNTGVAWFDICSTDMESDGENYESLRLGVLAAGDAHVGHAKGGTGTVRNLRLQMNGGKVSIGATTATSTLTVSDTSAPALAIQSSGTDRFYFAHATAVGNYFTGSSTGDHCIRGTGGRILIGANTSTPNPSIIVNNGSAARTDFNSDSLRIVTAKTPASATATGTQGQIAWDSNYIYVCTATNTWKRAALSSW